MQRVLLRVHSPGPPIGKVVFLLMAAGALVLTCALFGLAAWWWLVLCVAAVLLATIARARRRSSDGPLLVRGPEMRTVVMPPEPLAQRRPQLATRPRPAPGALRQGDD